jgi:hypothetical protein
LKSDLSQRDDDGEGADHADHMVSVMAGDDG